MKKDIKKKVITSDNFFPCYEGNKVEVTFIREKLTNDMFRVCVWGADDFGLEFDNKSIEKCKAVFEKIKDGITIENLKGLGFNIA